MFSTTVTSTWLAQTERHLAEGERLIAHQCELIELIERANLDTAQARELLRPLQFTQKPVC